MTHHMSHVTRTSLSILDYSIYGVQHVGGSCKVGMRAKGFLHPEPSKDRLVDQGSPVLS